MIKNQNCNDTIDGHVPVTSAALPVRRWFGKGLALLLADAGSLFDLLLTWQKRSQDRFELATLDDRTLKDLGISRSARDWEVAKPFWRA
ncbi:MAG: DUF1127 domain-containing protein [Rhodospirillales bacterium]